MKPLNKRQRNAAILKFILVYTFTALVIAVPIYATFKIPEKQCDINNEAKDKYKDKYEACLKEKSSMSSMKNVSDESKKDLSRICEEYITLTSDLMQHSKELDDEVFDNDGDLDQNKRDSILLKNEDIVKTIVKFDVINKEFTDLLK